MVTLFRDTIQQSGNLFQGMMYRGILMKGRDPDYPGIQAERAIILYQDVGEVGDGLMF